MARSGSTASRRPIHRVLAIASKDLDIARAFAELEPRVMVIASSSGSLFQIKTTSIEFA